MGGLSAPGGASYGTLSLSWLRRSCGIHSQTLSDLHTLHGRTSCFLGACHCRKSMAAITPLGHRRVTDAFWQNSSAGTGLSTWPRVQLTRLGRPFCDGQRLMVEVARRIGENS